MISNISARVLLDSVSPGAPQYKLPAVRLTTLEVELPRYLLAELNTHCQLSRNFRSSRAVPVERLIDEVERDPFVPVSWGRNRSGMQAGPEHDAPVRIATEDGMGELVLPREDAWLRARDQAVMVARGFAEAKYHKQIVNRLLEPWMYARGVVTATEWSNFFALRCHEDAEPHFRLLADQMRAAMAESTPRLIQPGGWHAPYVDDELLDLIAEYCREHDRDPTKLALQCSVARCARVSYRGHNGQPTTIDADLDLYQRLLGAQPMHASPAEHQGTPASSRARWATHWGKFRGWIQYRKTLPGECAA